MNSRGKSIKVVGFADKLKDVCHQVFGWAGLRPAIYYESEDGYKERNIKSIWLDGLFKSPREIWIEFGNHCRKYYDAIWLDALLKSSNVDVLIIKDLRFPNEAIGVRNQNGFLVKVMNPHIPDTDDEADCALVGYDHVWDELIVNDGSKDDLSKKAFVFGNKILERL